MVTKERGEELALFLDMRRREMDADELHTPSPSGQVFCNCSESDFDKSASAKSVEHVECLTETRGVLWS